MDAINQLFGHVEDKTGRRINEASQHTSQWTIDLGERLAPDARRWRDLQSHTEARLAAGLNLAAAAAAAARVETVARLGAGATAERYWSTLARTASKLGEEASNITTYSPETSFLQGIIGGGRRQGISGLLDLPGGS